MYTYVHTFFLQIPLLRLAAEQSKLVKPVAPAEDSEGLPSDEEDSSDDGDGDSGSSSDGSEEGEVCSSDMDLCSEKDDGSAGRSPLVTTFPLIRTHVIHVIQWNLSIVDTLGT